MLAHIHVRFDLKESHLSQCSYSNYSFSKVGSIVFFFMIKKNSCKLLTPHIFHMEMVQVLAHEWDLHIQGHKHTLNVPPYWRDLHCTVFQITYPHMALSLGPHAHGDIMLTFKTLGCTLTLALCRKFWVLDSFYLVSTLVQHLIGILLHFQVCLFSIFLFAFSLGW